MRWILSVVAFFIVLSVLFLMPSARTPPAQDTKQFGTAFFISRQYAVTNAHVVKNCDEATIRGQMPAQKAKVKARDDESDLALLELPEQSGRRFASLRSATDALPVGDKVLFVGYPGTADMQSNYSATAYVVNPQEAIPLRGRFNIDDVVQHGEGGSAVLDTSGNVVGVVAAKSTITKYVTKTMKPLSVQHVGVIIDLPALKHFLSSRDIHYDTRESGAKIADSDIYRSAEAYTASVQCHSRLPVNKSTPLRKTAPPAQ